jgi:curved DNA-binding protein CbpA
MAQTYYEILGVAQNATAAEIEAAFKAKAREVHPDTVPAENTYLRKVAAEAFKDLSEAKAVLLDSTSRQKYDAGLNDARGWNSQQSHAGPTGATPAEAPPSQGATPSQSSTQSRAGRSRNSSWSQTSGRSRGDATVTQASGGGRRTRRIDGPIPKIKDLDSFLFMVLGVAAVFSLVVLVSSGRVPPWWLAAVTACLGVLSFMNGMRPRTGSISSGRIGLIVCAIVICGISISLWAVSPSYFEIGAVARRADAAAARIYKSKKKTLQPTSSNGPAEGPVVVADESGTDASLPTKIWTNLKDGQIYRTRVNGTAVLLEAVENGSKSVGEISKCEFQRAVGGGPSWVGICSEPATPGEAERKSMATLSQFSDSRLEGSTGDIPVFVMTPVDTVRMGATTPLAANATPFPVTPLVAPPIGPPAEGEIIAEPDLSGLRDADRESIQTTCASDKLMEGAEKYNECVRKQLNELKESPKPRGLSKLSSADRDAVEFACTTPKLTQGPAAYNRCLATQMSIVKKRKK